MQRSEVPYGQQVYSFQKKCKFVIQLSQVLINTLIITKLVTCET